MLLLLSEVDFFQIFDNQPLCPNVRKLCERQKLKGKKNKNKNSMNFLICVEQNVLVPKIDYRRIGTSARSLLVKGKE